MSCYKGRCIWSWIGEAGKEFRDLADYYAVATMDEAVELRNAGIEKPILILGYTDESDYIYAINMMLHLLYMMLRRQKLYLILQLRME